MWHEVWPEVGLLLFWASIPMLAALLAPDHPQTPVGPGTCGWCGHSTHQGDPCPVYLCPCRSALVDAS